MIEDLYAGPLLEAAATIPAHKRLDSPDARARKVSRVCGSEIELEISVKDGVVDDLAMEVKACALGQAAASIFARAAIGAPLRELASIRDGMIAMLKENGPVPGDTRWAELEKLQPIREYPARHASTLLVFEVAADCAEQILGGVS